MLSDTGKESHLGSWILGVFPSEIRFVGLVWQRSSRQRRGIEDWWKGEMIDVHSHQ
jgi:hypothetical protein